MEPEASPRRRVQFDSISEALADAQLRTDALLHSGRVVDVWRAVAASGDVLAVKTPAPAWRGHRGVTEWLRREHAVLGALDHPRVVRAVGFIERGGDCALLTEYLGGGDLVPLAGTPPHHWIDNVAGIAAALGHVHARGYVHGDVKARNVLFPDGRPEAAKLADFGSALPVGAALPAETGTPAHRPPWRAAARAAPEDDVYAFAVLLYELLSGRLPFGPLPESKGWARAAGGLRNPCAGGPAALEALGARVLAALAAPGAVQIGTLTEFSDVIESVRHGLEPGEGRSPGTG